MRWVVVLLGLAGCYAPEPAPGAPCGERGLCPTPLVCAVDGRCERTAGTVDAAPGTPDGPVPVTDAPPGTSCWAAWRSGAPVLSAAAKVAELSTTADEGDPSLTSDALTIYFARGPAGNADLYVATRPDRASPFGTPVAAADLNSMQDDTKVSLSGDGLVAILASKRQFLGTTSSLYQATRTSATGAFGTPSAITTGSQGLAAAYDPELSSDGLVLYLSVAPVTGAQQLARASRTSPTGAFAATTAVAVGGTSGALADPTVSPDELVLVFTSSAHLLLATRTTVATGFALVGPLSVNEAMAQDGDATLTRDGCELFFMSNRAGTRDIYRSTVTPQ